MATKYNNFKLIAHCLLINCYKISKAVIICLIQVLRLSMESQPQNPEFSNNPENFHPCMHFKTFLLYSIIFSVRNDFFTRFI